MTRLPTKTFRQIIHSYHDIGYRCAHCGSQGGHVTKGRRLFRYLRRWRVTASEGVRSELWDSQMFCSINHRNAFFEARGLPTKPRLEVKL